jgi:dTDP-4-dehydrorhamnose reductase
VVSPFVKLRLSTLAWGFGVSLVFTGKLIDSIAMWSVVVAGNTDPDVVRTVDMLPHSVIEITDQASVERVLGETGPDVVINTVAYHRLAECEKHPDRAEAVNALGPRIVGRLGYPQVYISTDYVFTDKGPHEEVLPGAMPRSVYGRTKLAGEIQTLEYGGVVVRVAGLFGHHRSHKGIQFPAAVLTGTEPMRLPRDQMFTPTYAVDAAARIAYLALEVVDLTENDPVSGIYHAANNGDTTWAEFAEFIATVGSVDRAITGYNAKDALRPTDSRLVSTRLPALRHWRIALVDWSRRWHAERVSPLRAGWDA